VWGLLFAQLGRVVDQQVDDDVASRGFEEDAHDCWRSVRKFEVTSISGARWFVPVQVEGNCCLR